MQPSEDLMKLARHSNLPESEDFLDAVGHAKENDDPLDSHEIVKLAISFVNRAVSTGEIEVDERADYLTFDSEDDEDSDTDDDDSDDSEDDSDD